MSHAAGIPLKLPMPVGIEIHNCIVPLRPAATPPKNNNNKKKKKWLHQTEHSIHLLPRQVTLHLTTAATNNNSNNSNTKIRLATRVDRRRSTKIVMHHLDDCLSRENLTVTSYENLCADFFSSLDSQEQTSSSSSEESFLSIPLHPSRLCRMEQLSSTTVATPQDDMSLLILNHLPINSILVHFSDQSIRVLPSLYAHLRTINEKFVSSSVEEKRFEDTVFYSLDEVTSNGSNSVVVSSSNNGHEKHSKRSDNNNNKPSAERIVLDDLQEENKRLEALLEQQEQLYAREELQMVESSTTSLIESLLETLTKQNEQLERELARRQRHFQILEYTFRTEQMRLMRETSTLYDIATNDDTTTFRGLPVASAISMLNHLIHMLLPKYLHVFCRPPPLNTTPAQRNLIWMATLECQCRALRIPVDNDENTVLRRIQRIYQYTTTNMAMVNHHRYDITVGEKEETNLERICNGDDHDDKG